MCPLILQSKHVPLGQICLLDCYACEKTGVKTCKTIMPPKINMEHNNGGLEDDFPFQGFHVNLRGCNYAHQNHKILLDDQSISMPTLNS